MPVYAAAAFSPSRRAWVHHMAKNQDEAVEFARAFFAEEDSDGASVTIVISGKPSQESFQATDSTSER